MRDFTRAFDQAAYRTSIPIGRVVRDASFGPPGRPYREITEADVGRNFMFEAFGKKWMVSGFIGRILPGDVGKRVYQVGDILQVENDEQRNARSA